MSKLYEYKSEFYRLDRNVPIAVYKPTEKTERSQIAVLAMHGGDYLSFRLLIELAKQGFVAAGANPQAKTEPGWILDFKTGIEFMKNYPGVKKLILLGHSQGGCRMSCYQYIAENGTERFKQADRLVAFPELEPLTPGDGLMLCDANYGIMDVLSLDPAVRHLGSGYARIPELDMFNPENGYAYNDSHYTQEFITRFQKAQIKFYEDVLNYAKERFEQIKKGRGDFAEDEPLVIAGGMNNSENNKLFAQDTTLLGRTKEARPTLLKDGSVVNKVSYTVRKRHDTINPNYYAGAFKTTVRTVLASEKRFGDFGYNECEMWGDDWDFNFLRSCGNVKGISIPLLCTGNTGNHEFVNAEMNYVNAASKDKSIIMIEGADHNFITTDMEKYGDTTANAAAYMATWLMEPGRFID